MGCIQYPPVDVLLGILEIGPVPFLEGGAQGGDDRFELLVDPSVQPGVPLPVLLDFVDYLGLEVREDGPLQELDYAAFDDRIQSNAGFCSSNLPSM